MSNPTNINKLIDMFIGNANGVLTTITNTELNIDRQNIESFNFDSVSSALELPGVLLTINFSGDQNFQVLYIMPKKLAAVLSDLMMLGDGQVDYNPEEHNDAIQEMYNQILGSMASEISGMGVSLTGTITQVELTDMEIQKDFLEDNQMMRLNISIIGDTFPMFAFFDNFAGDSIDNLFQNDGTDQAGDAEFNMADIGLTAAPQANTANEFIQPQMQEQPSIPVSRASFSSLEETKLSPNAAVNIDMLYDIMLPITVELGRKEMKIKEVLEMGQGSVIELDKTAGDYVDLIVNGKKFAIGEVMVADENYAVRIVSLVSRKDRIKSLAKQ